MPFPMEKYRKEREEFEEKNEDIPYTRRPDTGCWPDDEHSPKRKPRAVKRKKRKVKRVPE